MKISFNEDTKVVEKIREGLRRKDGYCPCGGCGNCGCGNNCGCNNGCGC